MPRFASLLLLSGLLLFGCESEQTYLYEVNNVTVRESGVSKENLKSELEFLSLAYNDLFATTLTEDQLFNLAQAYSSLGDKNLIVDILIRNFLNAPGANVPSSQAMRSDVNRFITDTYKKFYVREPGEYELWYLGNLIQNDPEMTPEMIYYAFLTSDEYRFY
jgi:hypothetical protein